jgi:hypothetical protein
MQLATKIGAAAISTCLALAPTAANAASGTITYQNYVKAVINKTLILPKTGCANIKFTYKLAGSLSYFNQFVSFKLSQKKGDILIGNTMVLPGNPAPDPGEYNKWSGTAKMKVCRQKWTELDGDGEPGTTYDRTKNGVCQFSAELWQVEPFLVRDTNSVSVTIK